MSLKRLAPLLVLLVLIAVAFFLRLDRYFTLDALRENRAALTAFVQSHSLAAALGFVLTYIGVVALSVPGATIMTLAGGFLFDVPLGAALTIIGATAGASLLSRARPSATSSATGPGHFSLAWPMAFARMPSTTCCSYGSSQSSPFGP
jgi:hypothetical protein